MEIQPIARPSNSDAKSQPHYFRNFYARRTLRIFPLYYLVLAALFLILPHVMVLSPNLERARDHQVWVWTYLTNFYVAAKSSWAALSYVSHFWSLAIEEHFYLLWPLVVFSFRRETLERICVYILAGGLALRVALSLAGVSELSVSVLTPCRIDTMSVGALLALIARRDGGADVLLQRSGRAALWIGLAIVALSAWCTAVNIGLEVLHPVRGTLYALFFGALSLLSLRPRTHALARIFQGSVLRFFGKYSYGLYVYHGLLVWYFHDVHAEERFDAYLGYHSLAMAAKAAFGVSVSVIVAVLSFHLFERRFLTLKRFFEAGRTTIPATGLRGRDAPAPPTVGAPRGVTGDTEG